MELHTQKMKRDFPVCLESEPKINVVFRCQFLWGGTRLETFDEFGIFLIDGKRNRAFKIKWLMVVGREICIWGGGGIYREEGEYGGRRENTEGAWGFCRKLGEHGGRRGNME